MITKQSELDDLQEYFKIQDSCLVIPLDDAEPILYEIEIDIQDPKPIRKNNEKFIKVVRIGKFKNNELIQEFVNIRAATREFGYNSYSAIKACCDGKRELAYGFQWRYINYRIKCNITILTKEVKP